MAVVLVHWWLRNRTSHWVLPDSPGKRVRFRWQFQQRRWLGWLSVRKKPKGLLFWWIKNYYSIYYNMWIYIYIYYIIMYIYIYMCIYKYKYIYIHKLWYPYFGGWFWFLIYHLITALWVGFDLTQKVGNAAQDLPVERSASSGQWGCR